jgi:CRP-like cAMP-binding protein
MTTPTPILLSILDELPSYRQLNYAKDEIILQPTSDQDYCYIILSGFVKVSIIDNQGSMSTLVMYSAGELFPLSWILNRPSVDVYFTAMRDCVIAKLDWHMVDDLMKRDAAIANVLMRQITDQFALYTTRISNLNFKYGRERLAYRLLLMGFRFGITDEDTNAITLPAFSQQEIAETINMSRESVNRELAHLETNGIITYSSGRITILKPKLLRQELGDGSEQLYFDI